VTKKWYCNFYKVFVLGKNGPSSADFEEKILKFEDLETRFMHVEKI